MVDMIASDGHIPEETRRSTSGINYTQENGTVTIRVEQDTQQAHAIIRVQDNGRGIDPGAKNGNPQEYIDNSLVDEIVREGKVVRLDDEAVLRPLEMTSTTLQGSPAHGIRSTAADLTRFLAEVRTLLKA